MRSGQDAQKPCAYRQASLAVEFVSHRFLKNIEHLALSVTLFASTHSKVRPLGSRHGLGIEMRTL